MKFKIKFRKFPLSSISYKVLENEGVEFPFEQELDKDIGKLEADRTIAMIMQYLMQKFKTSVAGIEHSNNHVTYEFINRERVNA